MESTPPNCFYKKVTKLQNGAARVVTNRPNDKVSLPLTLQLVWLTVKEMIDFEKSVLFSIFLLTGHIVN